MTSPAGESLTTIPNWLPVSSPDSSTVNRSPKSIACSPSPRRSTYGSGLPGSTPCHCGPLAGRSGTRSSRVLPGGGRWRGRASVTGWLGPSSVPLSGSPCCDGSAACAGTACAQAPGDTPGRGTDRRPQQPGLGVPGRNQDGQRGDDLTADIVDRSGDGDDRA